MKIKNQIFMGNGDHSLAQMGHLYTLLGEAFTTLGGIQQPPRCIDPKEAFDQYDEDIKNGDIELESIANEIYVALTGRKVTASKKAKLRNEQ